jgi:hypothetical protein
VQELAALAIPAEAIVFEVRTYSRFVILVDLVLVPEFVIVMGKGALAKTRLTE